MTREPDLIDARLTDEAPPVSLAIAWADLRDLVLDAVGVDINGRHGFRVRVQSVNGTGNRRMSAIICGPKGNHDPGTIIGQSFISLFGELPGALVDAARVEARESNRLCFAAPLSSARPS